MGEDLERAEELRKAREVIRATLLATVSGKNLWTMWTALDSCLEIIEKGWRNGQGQ